MAKILIVDDDDIFLDAVNKNLQAEGFETVCAANGKIALQTLESTRIDAVVSDIRMPEMSGVELLKQVRASSQVPFILMTGFADIMETQDAHALGANEFLAKPFKPADLVSVLRSCLQKKKSALSSGDFCKLSINDFVSGRTIKFSIYVQLSEHKFIKLAHQGEDISLERIRTFREKGLLYLYLRRQDFRQYVGFSIALTETAGKNQRLDGEKKLNLLRHTGEILSDHIQYDGVDKPAYESAVAFVQATIDVMTDDPTGLEVLESLRQSSEEVLIHSVGVSLYSVMMAQSMEWHTPTNKIKIAMGGLLHDIGMKELSEELLQIRRLNWSREQVKEYESHPMRGLSILTGLPDISDDVREIVKQHHENCLSQGFPMSTRKALIHPMAKLISVADEFCYRVLKGSHSAESMTPEQAIEDMATNYGSHFDIRFLEALASLFDMQLHKAEASR